MISASEPNLKVRSALKQKVMERRITQSPILRRRHDKGLFLKRKPALSSMYFYAALAKTVFLFPSAAGILVGYSKKKSDNFQSFVHKGVDKAVFCYCDIRIKKYRFFLSFIAKQLFLDLRNSSS